MYKIYNKSSENMSEIKNGEIDLIVAGPPYNINTDYSEFKDNSNHKKYVETLKTIFKECYRVLNFKGTLIIESADSTFSNKNYVQLAGLIQKICINTGFYLEERHINFVKSLNGIELPEDSFKKNYITNKEAHSNCHQFLVFRKIKIKPKLKGKIFYFDYKKTKEHPCPFPSKTYKTLLSMYYSKGNNVLDPFMGSAVLGVEVLERKGNFFGYEIVSKYFKKANEKLKKLV